MLQLGFDRHPHIHYSMSIQDKLPKVSQLGARHPDAWETARQQKLAKMPRVSASCLLLANVSRSDLHWIVTPDFMPEPLGQVQIPLPFADSFYANHALQECCR